MQRTSPCGEMERAARVSSKNNEQNKRAMAETTEEKVQKAKEAEKKIEGALAKHGLNGFWAKLVASVIIAALAIAVGMFTAGCTMSYTKLPDGTVKAAGNVVLPAKVNTVTK